VTVPPVVIVVAMLVFSLAGGVAVKQFSLTRDVLWIITAYSLLSLSNVLWILVVDQNGIARTMILSSAGQIVLTTALGYAVFGEHLTKLHMVAAGLACLAVVIASLASNPVRQSPSHHPTKQIEEEADA